MYMYTYIFYAYMCICVHVDAYIHSHLSSLSRMIMYTRETVSLRVSLSYMNIYMYIMYTRERER